ncbi:dihydroxyacetone kinase subunit DhaL [Lichenihabitans sp. Uapishka_5]|uniref:dihydroxyacetone kinase subunit DhaL n=1 Tax=Lichenihabitans sp. Uapishka_5 TaxID=3037302 RepID=UPI0029E7F85A|nr:dihydroxyacetone kinase subunit DhaL [Lichenihabitans sp. Uapishka_5]MDX7950240.1 dihydroxyacetone kinase subunit DhaL [Lichenihabitans sp. Uapishka_5]
MMGPAQAQRPPERNGSLPSGAAAGLIRLFGRIAEAVEHEKDRLGVLDGAIGDADHGITMALGFRAVIVALRRLDPAQATPSDVFDSAAAAFLDAVGASTGPLYAAGLGSAARSLEGCIRFDAAAQAAMLAAIGSGIQRRGKGQRGDKTMLDVWLPAADAGEAALRAGADRPAFWARVAEAASAGAEGTRSMVAARGRAARLGQRSLGHLDPGAASAAIIIEAMRTEFGAA